MPCDLTIDRSTVWLKRTGQAAGFSALVLLPDFSNLTTSSRARLHTAVPLTTVAWANIFDMAIVALVAAFIFTVLRRMPLWPATKIILAVAVPLLIIRRNSVLVPFEFGTHLQIVVGVVAVAFLFAAHLFAPRVHEAVMRSGSTVLAAFGIFAILSCAQLLRCAAWHPPIQQIQGELAPRTANHHPRVVWIVFDELAYKETFGARPADLNLPNFDSFRQESTLYTDVLPEGSRTAIVLPSLLLGKQVTRVAYTWSNQVLIKTVSVPEWQRFKGQHSIFAAAHRNGWRTAVVGWFNPYCSMMKDELDDCYWTGWDGMAGPMSPNASTATNTFLPLKILAEKFVNPHKAKRDMDAFLIANHRATFENLRARSLATLENSDADFILLHLPIPHPPAIYSRHTGQFTYASGASYIDNLALADRTLGELLGVLQSSPRWPQTTVIVNGDHSWRVVLWRDGLFQWSPEDQKVSGGVFDSRPAVLVHRAAQASPATVSGRFQLILLNRLLGTQIKSERVVASVRGEQH